MVGITQVERDTGLSKDTLRMWERRYGFPAPARDEFGERLYDAAQVDKLRVIKRLLDAGQRPGKLMAKSPGELKAAVRDADKGRRGGAALPAGEGGFFDALALLRAHDDAGLQQHLSQLLLRQGLRQFVLSTVAPLNQAVGDAWMRGELAVFEEHVYTEQVQRLLRTAIQSLSLRRDAPRVLLTTLPPEQHGLGLLMVESLLAGEQVPCIALGTQTPLQDIAKAASVHRADIVALSFSAGFNVRSAADGIAALCQHIGKGVTVWIGGATVSRLKRIPAGVRPIPLLADVAAAVGEWRNDRRRAGEG